MVKKEIILCLMFLCFLEGVFAVGSLDELIESYDFSYKDETFEILDYSFNGSNLSLNVSALQGNYTLDLGVYSKNSNLSYYLRDDVFLNYFSQIDFLVDFSYLGEFDLALEFFLSDNGKVFYKNYSLFSFENFNGSLFVLENFSYYFNNSSLFVFFDSNFNDFENVYLVTNIGVFNSSSLSFELDLGFLNLDRIVFKKIVFETFNGFYSYELDKEIVLDSFDFDFNLVDEDFDLKYDYLLMVGNVDILRNGNYKFKGVFGNNLGDEDIIFESSYESFNSGLNEVFLSIDSTLIYDKKYNGEYFLKQLYMYDENGIVFKDFSFSNNVSLFYLDFFKPLSDLVVGDIFYNSNLGNGSILISNKGLVDAIAFDVKIVDYDYNLLYDGFVDYLFQNSSLELFVDLPLNLSDFYVFLDYKFNVDESNEENNVLFWPVFRGEICNDGIDNDFDYLIDEGCSSSCLETGFSSDLWIGVYCNSNLSYYMNETINVSSLSFNLDNLSYDNSSLRLRRLVDFENSSYVFSLGSFSDVFLYLDSELILDNTKSSSPKTYFSSLFNLSGEHELELLFTPFGKVNDFLYFNVSSSCVSSGLGFGSNCFKKPKNLVRGR